MRQHSVGSLLSALLILCLHCLSGCATRPLPGGLSRAEAGLAYADGAFCATVEGQLCRTPDDEDTGSEGESAFPGQRLTGVPWHLAATVSAGATAPDGQRVVSVTYQEPPSLAGLTVTRTTSPAPDGSVVSSVTLTLGDRSVTCTDGTYDRLLLPADALLASGDIRAVGQASDGRRTVTVASGVTPAQTMVYTFVQEASAPVGVRWEDASGWLDLQVDIRYAQGSR